MLRELKAIVENAINNDLSSGIDTIFQNVAYSPTVGQPYQKIWWMFSKPQNPTIAGNGQLENIRETGYIQINLDFPMGVGTGACDAQAQAIRTYFPIGKTFTVSTGSLIVSQSVEFSPARQEGDRWVSPVKIYFVANLFE